MVCCAVRGWAVGDGPAATVGSGCLRLLVVMVVGCLWRGALALGLVVVVAGCSGGGDGDGSSAGGTSATTGVVTSIDTGGSTTTSSPGAGSAGPEDFVAPVMLEPVRGPGPDEVGTVLPPGGFDDGVIVLSDVFLAGRAILDSQLEFVAVDPDAPPEFYVDYGSWPDRAWQPGFNPGDGVGVLDTVTNEITVFENVGLVNYAGARGGSGLGGPYRFVGVAESDETLVLDLEELSLTPLGGQVRFGGPALSPDQRWVMTDADHSEDGPHTLSVLSTRNLDQATWSYEAPDGSVFVDAGRFEADGVVTVQLRTTGAEGLQLFSYQGPVGGSLELVADPDLAEWELVLPGLVSTVEDGVAVVSTADGETSEIGQDEYLGCARGPAVALVREDRMRFIERDGSATTDIELELPGPVENRNLPVGHIAVGGYELYYVPSCPGAAVLVVDCEARQVTDFSPQLGALGPEPAIAQNGAVSLSDTAAVLAMRAGDQGALLIVDSSGPRFEPLGAQRVAHHFLSPSGRQFGLAVQEASEAIIQIRDTETLAIEAELRTPASGLESSVFTWTPTK